MDSDNRADEFVWIHDRTTGIGYDATPMRLAAHYGDFYSGTMIITNPLPWGNRQV